MGNIIKLNRLFSINLILISYLVLSWITPVRAAEIAITAPCIDCNPGGNTTGAGNDCDLQTSEDQVFDVTIPSYGRWKFSLCGSSFDTYLYLGGGGGSNALNFDGTDTDNDDYDYVSMPTTGMSNRDGTIEMWVRPQGWSITTGSPNTFRGVIQTRPVENWCNEVGQISIFIWGVNFYFRLVNDDGMLGGDDDVSCPAADLFTDNVWTHIACTWSATTNEKRIYINGIEKGSLTSWTPPTVALYGTAILGVGHDGCTSYEPRWAGDIDEVRILDHALSQPEIAADVAAEAPYPDRAGTVTWYHMDEAVGTSLEDASGNGHTGTLASGINEPTWTDGIGVSAMHCGASIGENNDTPGCGDGTQSYLEADLAAGSYYCTIEGNGGASGPYQLDITLGSLPPPFSPTLVSPDGISSGISFVNGRSLCRTSSGVLVCVYMRSTGANRSVFLSSSTDGGLTWEEVLDEEGNPNPVNDPAWDCCDPVIAIDSDDNLHVAYVKGPDASGILYYNRWMGGVINGCCDLGSWEEGYGTLICADGQELLPSIAVDGNDDIHLAWDGLRGGMGHTGKYTYSIDGGQTWAAIENPFTPDVNMRRSLSVAIGTDNSVNIFLRGCWGGGGHCYTPQYIHKPYISPGVWGAWGPAVGPIDVDDATCCNCAISSDNKVHMVYSWKNWGSTSGTRIRYCNIPAGGTLANLSPLVNIIPPVDGNALHEPTISVDENDDIYIVFSDHNNFPISTIHNLYVCKSTDGGVSFDSPTQLTISNTDDRPSFMGSRWPVTNQQKCEMNYVWVKGPTSDCEVWFNKLTPTNRGCSCCQPVSQNLGHVGTVEWGYEVTSDCEYGGKWSGSFWGRTGNTYHFDLCPDAPGGGTANFDADIKVCDSDCAILDGEDGSCSGANRPNDFQWICSADGLYYVIIAPNNSWNSHTCSGTDAHTFTMKYYRENTCETGTWTGLRDTDWFNDCNWSCQELPIITTNATIPDGCPNYPDVDASGAVCQGLTVGTAAAHTEASLTVSDGDLTAVGGGGGTFDDIYIHGTYNQSGGTVNFGGSAWDLHTVAGSEMNLTGGVLNCLDDVDIQGTLNMSGDAVFKNKTGGSSDAWFDFGATNVTTVSGNAEFWHQGNTTDRQFIVRSGASFTMEPDARLYLNATANPCIKVDEPSAMFGTIVVNTGTNSQIISGSQPLDINGDFIINSGCSFLANGINMELARNWINNGTFTHDDNTVILDTPPPGIPIYASVGGSAITDFYILDQQRTAGYTYLIQTHHIERPDYVNYDLADNVGFFYTPEPAIVAFDMETMEGSQMRDFSSGRCNGTMHGSPGSVAGIDGNAMNFSGAGDYIDIDYADIGSEWTIATWFYYPYAAHGSWHTLVRGSEDHQIMCELGTNILGMYDNAGGSAFRSSGYDMDVLAAGWHHLAAVGTGGTTKFYIDGSYVGTADRQSTTDIHAIGNYQGGGQQFGIIDEFCVINRAMTEMEIIALYNSQKIHGDFRAP